jgi:hypothetical protein
MQRPQQVFEECRRVLRPHGMLIVTSINPEWQDFNPSPHATAYLDAADLEAMLRQSFGAVELRFGFPVADAGLRRRVLSIAKRIAVQLQLIPKTMQGKTLLKRLAFGRLTPVPDVLTDDFAPVETPTAAPTSANAGFRIIYAIAHV